MVRPDCASEGWTKHFSKGGTVSWGGRGREERNERGRDDNGEH